MNDMLYRYKDYVDIKDIICDDECRFLIEADLKNGSTNKIALVIMKNPSKANHQESDQTINRVLEVMYESGYGKCYVVNLIPYYGTNSRTIAQKADSDEGILRRNDNYIKSKIEVASRIFVAWGGNSGFDAIFYDERIKEIKNMLINKKVYCYKKNKNGTPIHPSRNQWRKGIKDDDFIIYNFD